MASVTVTIIEAKDIIVADYLSLSDPFVSVKFNTKERLTQVKNNTCNPVWNEEFTFKVRDPLSDTIVLSVFDHDDVGAHDRLGHIVLSLENLVSGQTLDSWHDLAGVQKGTIHVKLQANNFPDPPSYDEAIQPK
jgi:Ca2+-dependent lipid-binding protein